MTLIIKPPTPIPDKIIWPTVFLAGSIEMGKATDWQTTTARIFEENRVVVFNPRRDSWDSTWKQSIEHPEFCKQVEWELDGLDRADLILFNFEPDTLSPITLMELGLHARVSLNLVVVCPEGFWRKGNVDIVCLRNSIPMFEDLGAGIAHSLQRLEAVRSRMFTAARKGIG